MLTKYSEGSKDRASFTFIRIWTLAEPQPMTNDISQSNVRPYDAHEIMMFLVKNVVTYENVICPINVTYENV